MYFIFKNRMKFGVKIGTNLQTCYFLRFYKSRGAGSGLLFFVVEGGNHNSK